jgi:hypothetical protein
MFAGKKWFPITFMGSIAWIAAYSYLMVWWANVAGDTVGIPPEVNITFFVVNISLFLTLTCSVQSIIVSLFFILKAISTP